MVNDILNDKERVEKFCREFNYVEEFEDYIKFLDDFLYLYDDIDNTVKRIQLCDQYISKLSNRLSENVREERVIVNIQRILLREKYRLFIMRDIVKLDEEVIKSADTIKNENYIAGYEDIITYCDKKYLINLVNYMGEFTSNIRFYKSTLQGLLLGNQVTSKIRFGDNFSDAYSDMGVI